MNEPTHLACNLCRARFEVTHIYAHPEEYTLTIAGNLVCPVCCDGFLDWEEYVQPKSWYRLPEATTLFLYVENYGQIPGVIVWRYQVN